MSVNLIKSKAPVVYHSLQQVVDTLSAPELLKATPAINYLLKVGQWNKILGENNEVLPLQSEYPATSHNNQPTEEPKKPFIVIEGLDGSGKTRVSSGLSKRLNLKLMRTPPKFISSFKGVFDNQNEYIKRAYYSLGNYMAANEVRHNRFGVVMDRYWSSTAAYALAHEMTTNGQDSVADSDFIWPQDLLQPDVIIFLVVSEETRRFRHAYRNTTNTKEEQTLANSLSFRQNLIDCYKRIQGPPMVEVDANDASPTATVDENVEAVIRKVYEEVLTKLNIPDPVSAKQSTKGKLSHRLGSGVKARNIKFNVSIASGVPGS